MKYVNKIEQKFRIKMLKQVYYVQLLVFFFYQRLARHTDRLIVRKSQTIKSEDWGEIGRDRGRPAPIPNKGLWLAGKTIGMVI